MREQGVREAFERLSADYDSRFPRIIPRYAEFHSVIVERVTDHREAGGPAGPLVDLGCGTGELSRRLLEALSNLPPREPVSGVGPREALANPRLHCVDLSSAMVERARAKLAPWGPRVSFAVGNVLETPLPHEPATVVSALAVHHLDPTEKRALFLGVHDALAPGGVFVLGDAVAGETKLAQASYMRHWVLHMRASGMSGSEVDAVLTDHRRHDLFSGLAEQMGWMREAGFESVECLWKFFLLAVVAGEKANGRTRSPD